MSYTLPLELELFDEYSNFIFKYLEKKKNHTECFRYSTLVSNGYDITIKQLLDHAQIFSLEPKYIDVLEKNEKYVKVQLTKKGLEVASIIRYNRDIVIMSLPYKLIWVIGRSIRLIIQFSGHPKTRSFFKVLLWIILSIGGAVIVVLTLMKWYKTGDI